MFDLDPLILQLAAEFKARDMRVHLEHLRRYYAARRRRARAAVTAKVLPWNEDLVIEWLCLLQVPPFDKIYQERSVRARCECGVTEQAGGSAHVEVVFEGGCLWCCRACGVRWLDNKQASKG